MRCDRLFAAAGLAALCATAPPAAAQHVLQQLDQSQKATVDRLTAPLSGHKRRGQPPPPVVSVVAIKFANVVKGIPDNAALGAKLADVLVFNNDGSPFTGTIGFGPPDYNAGGCYGVSGSAVVLACHLTAADDGRTLLGTIVAHDPTAP
jgi:hypothetical protein